MQNGHEEMQCDLPFTCQCCRMERQTPIAEPTVHEIERVLDSATQLYIAWHLFLILAVPINRFICVLSRIQDRPWEKASRLAQTA